MYAAKVFGSLSVSTKFTASAQNCRPTSPEPSLPKPSLLRPSSPAPVWLYYCWISWLFICLCVCVCLRRKAVLLHVRRVRVEIRSTWRVDASYSQTHRRTSIHLWHLSAYVQSLWPSNSTQTPHPSVTLIYRQQRHQHVLSVVSWQGKEAIAPFPKFYPVGTFFFTGKTFFENIKFAAENPPFWKNLGTKIKQLGTHNLLCGKFVCCLSENWNFLLSPLLNARHRCGP